MAMGIGFYESGKFLVFAKKLCYIYSYASQDIGHCTLCTSFKTGELQSCLNSF